MWYFQFIHHDLWDYDSTSAPQLITIRHDGKSIDAVAEAGKVGFLYVFDRVTGKPIWPIEERAVPKSDVPGEQSWPTQPFPTAPPPFARQTITSADVNPYLKPEERDAWKKKIEADNNQGLFTPTVAVQGDGLRCRVRAEDPTGAPRHPIRRKAWFMFLRRTGRRLFQSSRNAHCPPAMGATAHRLRARPSFKGTASPAMGPIGREQERCRRSSTSMLVSILTSSSELSSVGKGDMPAFPSLSGANLEALYAYLLNPEGKARPSRVAEPPATESWRADRSVGRSSRRIGRAHSRSEQIRRRLCRAALPGWSERSETTLFGLRTRLSLCNWAAPGLRS